jgi:hypothetical protein
VNISRAVHKTQGCGKYNGDELALAVLKILDLAERLCGCCAGLVSTAKVLSLF